MRAPGRGRGTTAARVLAVLLTGLLAARLWYLQVPMSEHYQRLAADNRVQELVVPAARGQILDVQGRPLVRNRTELVVSADYHALAEQSDGGEEVLRRVAAVLDADPGELRDRTRLCGDGVPRPCWPGSPYQPVTLAEDVEPRRAMQIMERREAFPGISAQSHSRREYPYGEYAAQALGYLQPVTEQELVDREEPHTRFTGVEQAGRTGVEAVYDAELRGDPGVRRLAVDRSGAVTGTVGESSPKAGHHLVTSIDAGVQAIAEEALAAGIERSRDAGHPADSGAVVVLDVREGRVVALASAPGYDPDVWHGGIDEESYTRLLSPEAGEPLLSRAVQGGYPPASTFKVASLAAAVADGYPLDGTYDCPGSYRVGDREFANYGGGGHGSLTLHEAIVLSCNTVFYRFAHEQWLRDGGERPDPDPADPMTAMAKRFGFGEPTGIDLPDEAAGRVPDRRWKQEHWENTREEACDRAEHGYPEVEDPDRARYLRSVAREHCAEGDEWRAGDAANFAIGQGDLLVTPLQLARAYAAVANGGTLHEPRIGRALLAADGSAVVPIAPGAARELEVEDRTLAYLRDALSAVPGEGTGAGAFAGFPLDELPVAGKTGTATLVGQRESAWFASYAPADAPRFAVVALLSQGGTGGTYAAPVVREVYEGVYGLSAVGSAPGEEGEDAGPALPQGVLPEELPRVRPDGTITAPGGAPAAAVVGVAD